MAKHFFERWLPSVERVKQSRVMALFGQQILHPQIWYVNRRSITKAMFVGTFLGLIPLPFHGVLIIAAVLLLRINLPLCLALSWLSNPITVVPIIYAGFWTGTQVFDVQMVNEAMIKGVLHQVSHWLSHWGQGHVDLSLAKILMVGTLLLAFLSASLVALSTNLLWRWSVIRHWKKRQQIRARCATKHQSEH